MALSRKNNVVIKEVLILTFCIFLSILLCVKNKYSVSILYGIELWFACVLPSLFPYFFITYAISSLSITEKVFSFFYPVSKKMFNLSGQTGYAFLLSIISGYPVGAKTVADLYLTNKIEKTEAERALAICSTSSPTFLIASIGGITFNNSLFGLMLFLCHILSAIITGVIFSFYKRKDKPTSSPKNHIQKNGNILSDGIYSSIISILTVGGTIALFSLFTDVILDLKILSPLARLLTLLTKDENLSNGLLIGLFECTKGIKILSSSGISFLALPVTASICGFGGLSIITQSLAFAKKAKIKTAPFILAKITAAALNFIIGLIISLICF